MVWREGAQVADVVDVNWEEDQLGFRKAWVLACRRAQATPMRDDEEKLWLSDCLRSPKGLVPGMCGFGYSNYFSQLQSTL